MDTTVMSELEYLNLLPELAELDDSSFLKGSFVNERGAAGGRNDNSKDNIIGAN
jgi:hypothetical protein